MLRVMCDICRTVWFHHGPGPIEDRCRNGGPPGEHLTILLTDLRLLKSRL